MAEADPARLGRGPDLARAVGHLPLLEHTLSRDTGWVPPHGALKLPPLRAVTHSSLDRLPPWQAPRLGARKRRLAAARLA